MVNADGNNNKFYRMINNGSTFTVEFGRVGVGGFQTSSYPISDWNKKKNEKLKKGYVDQTRLVAEVKAVDKKKSEYLEINNPSVAKIVERLQSMARQAIKENYTVSTKMVNKLMIVEAQDYINKILVESDIARFNNLLIELFKIIPRKMSKVALYLATSKDDYAKIIQREQDLLDIMSAMVQQDSATTEAEENDAPIHNMTILEAMGLIIEPTTVEDVAIIKHNLGDIENRYFDSWRVTNIKTQKRYDQYIKDANIKVEKLMWHGTISQNVWSIILTGLSLRPNAPINGKMWGYGVYTSPQAAKSLNYTSIRNSYWVNGTHDTGFMFLYDCAYGNPLNVSVHEYKYSQLTPETFSKQYPQYDSLHAHKGVSLRNDEIIFFKEESLTVRYLVELK